MEITFVREVEADAEILRSSWQSVPQHEGMYRQFETELMEGIEMLEEALDTEVTYNVIEKRRRQRGGELHPGRRFPPAHLVFYEFVIAFVLPNLGLMKTDVQQKRVCDAIQSCLYEDMGMPGSFKLGNVQQPT